MEQKLRVEQVEAGNRYMRMVLGGSLDAVEWAQLATHLQYAAPEYAGDVLEDSAEAAWQIARRQNGWTGIHGNWADVEPAYKQQWREVAAGVAGVVLDRVDRLKKPNVTQWQAGYNAAISDLRASLLRPVVPTLEEEVTDLIIQATSHKWPESVTSKEVLKIVQRRGAK